MAIAPDAGATTTYANASSGAVTITTVAANTIILLFVSTDRTNAQGSLATVSPAPTDTRSLTWALHKQTNQGPFGASNSYNNLEIWWAFEPTAQSHTITVNFSATFDNAGLRTESFTGCKTAAPFDTNASCPSAGSSASGTAPSIGSMATDYDKTVLIGASMFAAGSNTNAQSAGTGFTSIVDVAPQAGSLFSKLSAEYQTTESSSPQSAQTVAFNAVWANWIAIATALVDSSAVIPSSGVTYPQLERGIRGLNRGVAVGAYRRVMHGWRKRRGLWLPQPALIGA